MIYRLWQGYIGMSPYATKDVPLMMISDGQKRPVYIYRLLTAGTIDGKHYSLGWSCIGLISLTEKIFQRQITKIGLSDAMMGTSTSSSKSKTDSFTSKELRDLFSIHPHAICHTHELLACACSTLAGSAIEDDGHLAVNPVRKFVQPGSDEEDEDEVGFVRGTQIDVDKISKKEIRKKHEALSSLAEWTHVNCMRQSAVSLIQDRLLRSLVHTPRGGESKSLDDEFFWDVDEKGPSEEEETPVRDVPGGTMTFIFERVSKTGL
ncbi:helicase [Serendipita sp. 396]|nr:helicase [Serendipita sp. 396]